MNHSSPLGHSKSGRVIEANSMARARVYAGDRPVADFGSPSPIVEYGPLVLIGI
jgi:hypothetical protein